MKSVSNQWGKPNGGYSKNFMNKDKSAWKVPSSPPVPMPIILRRALVQFNEGQLYKEKELFYACKKLNKNVTKKMFQVAYNKWLLTGEGFEPKLYHFVKMNF